MAAITLATYRRVLNNFWQPRIGEARIRKKDRPVIDPFTIQDAETLIAGVHRDWGEAQGNYDEFRFFAGLRPSEQVALLVSDFDSTGGTLTINKARVGGVDKNSTKTGEDRRIALCPRDSGIAATNRASRVARARRKDRSRSSVLQEHRSAHPQSAVRSRAMATNARSAARNSLPQTVLRAALFPWLEPNDRRERTLGC
jgi:integrase